MPNLAELQDKAQGKGQKTFADDGADAIAFASVVNGTGLGHPGQECRPGLTGAESVDLRFLEPVSRETGRQIHESGGPFSRPDCPIDADYFQSIPDPVLNRC